MSITIEVHGRRAYAIGNTFPIKDCLRSIGAHWDADRKAWWVASTLQAKLEKCVGKSTAQAESLTESSDIIGRATYKGRDYLLIWEGTTKRGDRAAKLAFRDGSKQFWANDGEYSVTKRYRSPISLSKLNEMADEYREQNAAAKEEKKTAAVVAAMTPEQRQAKVETDRTAMMATAATRAVQLGLTVIGSTPLSFNGTSRREVGEVRANTKKGEAKRWYLIVAVGKFEFYYHSEDDCEDQDCFCGQYGRKEFQQYWAVEVTEPQADRIARETKEAAAKSVADAEAAKLARYAAAKAEIPGDYRKRHGALFGGVVSFGGQSDAIVPVAFGELRAAKWEQVGQITTRAKGGSIDGRIRDQDTLYRTTLVDGRLVYREVNNHDFGDTLLESYWFPLDLFAAVCAVEVKARGITPQSAVEWLSQYRGCVDTELYEFAAQSLPEAEISPQASLSGGTESGLG